MSGSKLDNNIEFLKGVGPKKAEALRGELGIQTFMDLLQYYPYKYVDRSSFTKIIDLRTDNVQIQTRGKLIKIEEAGAKRSKRLVGILKDESGLLELVWFKGIKWLKKSLQLNEEYIVFGKPQVFNGRINVTHPEMNLASDQKSKSLGGLQPMYLTTEKMKGVGLDSKGMRNIIKNLVLECAHIVPENVSHEITSDLNLLPRNKSYSEVHFPSNQKLLERAKARLKFEEFYFSQLKIAQQKDRIQKKIQGYIFDDVGEYFHEFYQNHMPFELTGAQKRVIKEVRKDMGSGKQMNRLVQGDVGSGKTFVAFLSMLIAVGNGYQAALMAPTEILASQHGEEMKKLGAKVGIRVELLTGSVKTAARREIHAGLEDGTLHILVGTHALIEDKVKFQNLGLVVIDEQHRFGVAQRAKLWTKNVRPPHVLVMTATPIPRTLAMTVYGDLDTSIIDELPPGRKPVKTVHFYDAHRIRVFGFIEEEIKKGRQVYIVYPLIEESAQLDYKDLEDGYESITRRFPSPEYQVSIVHGRQKPKDKDFEMQRFVTGKTQIMVATTVIEVGVNVPNASVMVIESAEKFGLAQLHQLRGRVGRGAEQSFCILMTKNKISQVGRKRIKTMCDTNDGFKIAEVDMQLRGPGDIEGTRQSGDLDFKLASLVEDQNILRFAHQKAFETIDEDPTLSLEKNKITKVYLAMVKNKKINWGRIS